MEEAMTRETIIDAFIAAKEFTKRCDAVLTHPDLQTYQHFGFGNMETSALRRQSMELTRKLAEMRKP
jgi:hypothetical protein